MFSEDRKGKLWANIIPFEVHSVESKFMAEWTCVIVFRIWNRSTNTILKRASVKIKQWKLEYNLKKAPFKNYIAPTIFNKLKQIVFGG